MLHLRTAGASPSPRPAATNIYSLPVRRREAARHWPTVDISPRDIVNRRATNCDGMAAEIVQATRRERIDIRFRAPVHLLVVVEQAARLAGETSVEGLPRSTLRDLRRKLTFVPAGHDYQEWHEPSLLPRAAYFYLDPEKLLAGLELDHSEALRAPRLFFEDTALWETTFKLRSLMESPDASRLCFEALAVILAHELVRRDVKRRQSAPPARGGLAAWQQRILIDYIEQNLAEQIPLATLAQLVQLSLFHFAVLQAVLWHAAPPVSCQRRIEHAKRLLAKSTYSVTTSARIGFETSSFTAAFRKATGLTPTPITAASG